MNLPERETKRALRQARQQRKPQLYDDPELGKVWITERALVRYSQALSTHVGADDSATAAPTALFLAKRDIALHAYKAWLSQLQWQTVGQQELLLSGFE